MTTMTHKSPDAKRHRRTRYKRACKPIMERLGCTAMQVAEAVTGVIDDNIRLKRQLAEVEEQRDKLQAFKDWVHAYLDSHDVPHHPPGTHGAAGCRIGDRMDWLMERVVLVPLASTIKKDD